MAVACRKIITTTIGWFVMAKFHYNGQTIRYYSAGRQQGFCIECWEDVKYKTYFVKVGQDIAHFRCKYPEAYEKRRSWVAANSASAVGNQPDVKVTYRTPRAKAVISRR